MTILTIKANHPARKEIGNLGDYFESKGHALRAIDDILNRHAMKLACGSCEGDEGWTTFDILSNGSGTLCCDDCNAKNEVTSFNNCVAVSWYKCREGRWEVIKYIS